MKKIIVLFFSVMLLFSVASCSSKETPEEVVANGLTAIKNLDLIKMQEYIDSDDIAEEDDLLGDGFEDQDVEYVELLVKNLEYEILGSSINDDEAVVETKITNIDMSIVMEEYISQAFILAMSNIGEEEVDEDELQKEMEELFIELLSDEDVEMTSIDVDITLNDVDGKWKMDLNNELINALFGGFMDVIEELEE